MVGKKSIIFIILMIFLIPIALANFEAYADSSELTICECSTAYSIVNVINIGSPLSTYNVELLGSAAKYTQAIPNTFNLMPGESEQVSLIVSVPCGEKGDYKLKTRIDNGFETKEITQDVLGAECSNMFVTKKGTSTKTTDPCGMSDYEFNIMNTGAFQEKYTFKVKGIPSDWVSFTEQGTALVSNQDRDFTLFVRPPCDEYGIYDFNLIIEAEYSGAKEEIPLFLNINPDYGLEIEAEDNYVVCNGNSYQIPIKITNTAKFPNTFETSIAGPKWAELSNKRFTLPKRSYAYIWLDANPHMLDNGHFDVQINVTEETGKTTVTKDTMLEVDVCNWFEIDVLEWDYACSGESLIFPVTVKNVGSKDNTIPLQTWGEFETELLEQVFVEAESSKVLNMTLNIPENFTGGGRAGISAYLNTEEFSDRLWLDVIEADRCYLPELDIEEGIKVVQEDVREIPIVITNTGARDANYTLSIDKDYDWIILPLNNPAYVKEGETKVVELIAFPSVYTNASEYDVTLTLSHAGMAYSKTFVIEVIDNHVAKEDKFGFGWLKSIGRFFRDYAKYIIAGFVILAVVIGAMKFLGDSRKNNDKKAASASTAKKKDKKAKKRKSRKRK